MHTHSVPGAAQAHDQQAHHRLAQVHARLVRSHHQLQQRGEDVVQVHRLRAVASTSPIYQIPGCPIDKVFYRRTTSMRVNTHEPRIRGAVIGERTAVFFSQEDLTGSLLGSEQIGLNVGRLRQSLRAMRSGGPQG